MTCLKLTLLSILILRVTSVPAQNSAPDGPAARPAISFTKDFPGSVPAYYSITLRSAGEAAYRAEYKAALDEEPTELKVSEASAQEAFGWAEKLGWFREMKIESGKPVAQMGKKTFRYESGADRHEVSYNHTELPEAIALTSWFERLSATQQHIDRIEYLLRFDRLGIVKELLQVEMDLNQNRLLEPALLLPALNKLLASKSLVNVAHDRAALIVEKINAGE